MRSLKLGTILFLCALAGASDKSANSPLGAFFGHWTGTSKMLDTKFSKAEEVRSVADCKWSPQQDFLVCEQTIDDSHGQHKQLTIFGTNSDGKKYTFYTLFGNGKPAYMGSLKIDGNVWEYGPSEDAKDKYPLFRTVNTFNNGVELSDTDFTEDGKTWTKMLHGELKKQ
jgi:hypothetical protein